MSSILVVDDELEIAHSLQAILADEGYSVEVRGDGEEALSFLTDHTPDLIVCDVMMPRMDGIELLRRLRQDQRWRELPVLLMSAVDPPTTKAQARWTAFLKKPFSLDVLLSTVESLLTPKHRRAGGAR